MYTIEEFDTQKTKVMNYILYKKRTQQEVKNTALISMGMNTLLLLSILESIMSDDDVNQHRPMLL